MGRQVCPAQAALLLLLETFQDVSWICWGLCLCCALLSLIYHFLMSALQLRSGSWSSSCVKHGVFPSVGGIWGLAGSCSRVCSSSSISIPAAPPSSRSVPASTRAVPGTLPRGICSQIRRNKGGNHPSEVCWGLIQSTQSPGQQSSPGAQPDVELGSCLSRNCFCIPMRSAAAWARGEELAGRALGAGPG